LKKVVGWTDIEYTLARLDWLTQEEARMAAAQSLKVAHGVDYKVQQVADHIDDQKRSLSNNLSPSAMKAHFVSQGISYGRT
jgi:hypothetical protein